jgi:hypothetical protein
MQCMGLPCTSLDFFVSMLPEVRSFTSLGMLRRAPSERGQRTIQGAVELWCYAKRLAPENRYKEPPDSTGCIVEGCRSLDLSLPDN